MSMQITMFVLDKYKTKTICSPNIGARAVFDQDKRSAESLPSSAIAAKGKADAVIGKGQPLADSLVMGTAGPRPDSSLPTTSCRQPDLKILV
ncbi:hypothetical protein RQP53_09345 [Paucibacter sp. APW11]|uniref:Uncharacterized protein n=1 Tax=Roseateles aquae TaxID=3077235 RepID=A0ABU3PAC3_9BURK|nr:hypothetical protein [Paucibacter sp. APW11]MDT8999470.1 hypothetical protein [Paucibacter sp. APW11]